MTDGAVAAICKGFEKHDIGKLLPSFDAILLNSKPAASTTAIRATLVAIENTYESQFGADPRSRYAEPYSRAISTILNFGSCVVWRTEDGPRNPKPRDVLNFVNCFHGRDSCTVPYAAALGKIMGHIERPQKYDTLTLFYATEIAALPVYRQTCWNRCVSMFRTKRTSSAI
jgi:hypothetical protein